MDKYKYTLHCGDNLNKLRAMPDNSIDLTVTSPPYDTMDKDLNIISGGGLRSYNGYSWNFKELSLELYRVTKDGGVVVWVVGDKTDKGTESGTSFRQALYFKDVCGFNLHDTMIYYWERPPLNQRRYEQHFEYMFIFSKGSPNTFNPITEKSKGAGRKVSRKGIADSNNQSNRISLSTDRKYTVVKDTKVIGNVWRIVSGRDLTDWERILVSGHPARFPERLAEDHILSWSNAGDTVLDPFMGSGTTIKMAILNNRLGIGIESSREYFDIAKTRIDRAADR